jgi:hypothetical protein
MRIIDKDNRMVTTFETTQTNVEGSSVIRAPKKQKKEKPIENLIMKYPKGLNKTKCKHVDESIRSEFSNCFPLGNKHVEGVKVHVD